MKNLLSICLLTTTLLLVGCSSSEEDKQQAQADKEAQANLDQQQKLSDEVQEDMRLHATTPDIDPNMKIHQVNINEDKAILKMVGLPVVDKEKGLDAKNSPMTQYWFHKSLSNNLEIDLSPNFIQVWWKFDEKDPKKVNEMFLLGQKVTRSLLGDADGPRFYLDLIQTKEEIQQVQLNNGIIVQKARCFNDLCRYEIVRN
ncbi:hypothetical protein [Acinetobacter nectaris]|uniref:hypothetical protein n=1 Tax=Acinetobacter nectaris TaxID=1219382 RepID=UPI001F3FC04E|nr:hypothetical protein [Acinetobacter nectaris]MCF9034696.1 hypothetical protein [Acinetobacter nectaris]